MLRKSRVVALLLAFTIAGITTGFLSLINNISTTAIIVVFFICFSTSYLLVYITLDFFVFNEISKIYKILSKLQEEDFTFLEEQNTGFTKGLFKNLNTQLISYARLKEREIEELKREETFRKEFIADVSHELKTPIFAAQGYIHTLMDGAAKDKNVRNKFLKKAAKNLDGLDRLVQDLLILSKIDTGAIKMEFISIGIADLLVEVVEQFEEKVERKNIKLEITEDSELDLEIFADHQKMYQVMVNLISNAIKYKKDDETCVIDISIKKEEERVRIGIRDNGIGIPKEDVKRIFERFYRVEKSRSKDSGGTGLGLAIVKNILEKHNSKIEVISEIGIGSEFYFYLEAEKNEKAITV